MRNKLINTRKIALGGVLGALAVISLLLASLLPTGKLSLYALSSFFIAVIIMKNGPKAGWVFFAATSLTGLIIVPNKLTVIPYVVFFGIYGLVKYYIEKMNKILPELILKLVFFNICFGLAYVIAGSIFNLDMAVKIQWWLIIIILEILFLIYDFVYSLFIKYYKGREKLIRGSFGS